MHESAQETAEKYLHALASGDSDAVISLFAAEPSIHDPTGGHVGDRAAVRAFVAGRHTWLSEGRAAVEHLRTTRIPERSIVEYVLHLELDGRPYPLPYAVVGEYTGGDALKEIRVYHSMWPLIGAHEVRRAILPAGKGEKLGDVIAIYQEALAGGDVATIVKTFEPDGYFREPAGGPHVHRGTEQLTKFMAAILRPGGIALEHCTVSDDGVACAIEFNAVAFGETPLVPQAGVAVYERGASGRLRAARVYDDVNVEALAA